MSSDQSTCSDDWLQSKFDNPRYVAIKWGDAHCTGDASWTSSEDLFEAAQAPPSVILTVGVLVYSCTTHYAVMSTIIEDGSAGGQVHIIPTGWVISLKDLA